MRTVLYARVSTDGQSTQTQLQELREVAKRTGMEVVEEFVDHGVSGSKDRRPALDKLMRGAIRREFDIVMAPGR